MIRYALKADAFSLLIFSAFVIINEDMKACFKINNFGLSSPVL